VAPQPVPVPCGATPGKPDAAQKFPFPGETDAAAPSLNGVPQAPLDAPDAPAAAGSPAPATKAAKDFPFPGEADASGSPDASSSSSSSSSSSRSSSNSSDDASAADANSGANPALKDQGSEGAAPGRHLLHRVNPVGTKLQSDDEREAEDLDIARYYTQTGDLQGAYLRSQDAVKLAPDDADAHFVLAETAAKLNKRDEAIAEYNACLKLDPVGKEAKAARKALERLKP
jgi:tetratricopeptide (TPR) repeat protein